MSSELGIAIAKGGSAIAIGPKLIKGRVWSKIMFCVWLAFAVKIVVAMTAKLNLTWFTRYEPRKLDRDDVTAFSLTRTRAVYNTMAFDPRKVLEEPNFCKNFISDNKISYT